jgi:Flp pilus assembly protein TadD
MAAMGSTEASAAEQQAAALIEASRYIEALELLDQAIAREPESGRLYALLGQALQGVGRPREAIEAFNAACFSLEDPWRCLVAMGDLHMEVGEVVEAATAFRSALFLKPELQVLQASIAFTLFRQARLEEALGLARQAVVVAGQHAHAHYVLGTVLFCRGDLEAAKDCFERAIAIDPDHVVSHASLGQVQLMQGHLGKAAWQEYAWRLRMPNYRQPPAAFLGLPEWEGQAVEGNVVLWVEQGLGDCLFSLRFVERMGLAASRIVVAVDERLVPLVQRSMPDVQVIDQGSGDPQALGVTHRFALCSGGMHADLADGLEEAWHCPYLFAAAEPVMRFRRELDRHSARVKIGISWCSDPQRSHGRDKSVPLSLFGKLAELEGVQLVDLQYGDTREERQEFLERSGHDLLHFDFDQRQDLDSLAALITACDAVVTVSNVTAHLAGALGKKGVVMLPADKGLFWYWHRNRSTSPWYPTLSLVRKERGGSWEEVMAQVVRLQ